MAQINAQEFAQLIAELIGSGDIELEQIGRRAEAFFLSPEKAPQTVDYEKLLKSVSAYMPTPFAMTFRKWTDIRAKHEAAMFEAQDKAGDYYRESFDAVWTCWRQLVHFLPFALLAPVAHLREELQRHGGKSLALTYLEFQSFYQLREGDDEKNHAKFEGQQYQLLKQVIELCARLDHASQPRGFFFQELLNEERRFEDLFPERLLTELEFLRNVRNRNAHGRVGLRDPGVVRSVQRLVDAAFLDAVSIVAAFARGYGIYYIAAIDDTSNGGYADAVSFSGVDASMARFALDENHARSSYISKFVPYHVYLINRRRELSQNKEVVPLSLSDYVDLTPFVVEQGRLGAAPFSSGRGLYALEAFRSSEPDRFIRFFHLDGRASVRYPAQAEIDVAHQRRELDDFFDELIAFSSFVEAQSDYMLSRRQQGSDFPRLRQKLWESVSKRNLAHIIPVDNLTYDAKSHADAAVHGTSTFDETLYVAPTEAAEFTAFFESDRRGLLFTGGSGYGKTTLLVVSFLERLRAGDIAIFLSAQRLTEASLKESLNNVISQCGMDWTAVHLDRFVKEENAVRKGKRAPTQAVIYLDAINEYTAVPNGAQELLGQLVRFVENGGEQLFGQRLPNIRIVASCRTETWLTYRATAGAGLNGSAFHCEADGEPIAVSGFEDNETRKALYERYREHYAFSATPYHALSTELSELFRSPLMLALVAETYRPNDAGKKPYAMPQKLDYLSVFANLTQRKIEDGMKLVPQKLPQLKELIKAEMSGCLAAFGQVLYEQLTNPKDARGYVTTVQTTLKPMQAYSEDRNPNGPYAYQITALQALSEVGLVSSRIVSEYDPYLEREELGKAFAFFHDRYAEYQLASFYIRRRVGEHDRYPILPPFTLESSRDKAEVEQRATTIEQLIRQAKLYPVLAGALEHWFLMNLNVNKKNVSVLVPLCERLSVSNSGTVRRTVADILTGLVLRGSVPARQLYEAMLTGGGPALCTDLALALAETWPDVSSDIVRDFIEACQPKRDELILETLADAFVDHVSNGVTDGQGNSASVFVSDVCRSLPRIVIGLVPNKFVHSSRSQSHFKFVSWFASNVIVTCSQRPAILFELRDLIVEPIRPLLQLITGQQPRGGLRRLPTVGIQELLKAGLAWLIPGLWENLISCKGANDTFFVENDGLVQRDILFDYLPFLCALHNRDSAQLSLEVGSPFLDLSLRMLNARKLSIVSFAAYASLTIAIGEDYSAVQTIVKKVMQEGSYAGRYNAANVIGTYTKTQPVRGREALIAVRDEMLPWLLDERENLSHLLICAAGIVETDVAGLWEFLIPSLDVAFAALARRNDLAEMLAFGQEMRCLMFFTDVRIAHHFVEYIVQAKHLEPSSPWKAAALEICCGMLIRDRKGLMLTFAQHNVPDSMIDEVEMLRTQDVLDQKRSFGARARWDGFIVRTVAENPQLSHLLFKHVFGSLAFCNSVDEWAAHAGDFMLEALRLILWTEESDARKYDTLSVADIEASTRVRPIQGGGKPFIPRRKHPQGRQHSPS